MTEEAAGTGELSRVYAGHLEALRTLLGAHARIVQLGQGVRQIRADLEGGVVVIAVHPRCPTGLDPSRLTTGWQVGIHRGGRLYSWSESRGDAAGKSQPAHLISTLADALANRRPYHPFYGAQGTPS